MRKKREQGQVILSRAWEEGGTERETVFIHIMRTERAHAW